MSTIPEDLSYSEDHEWVRAGNGGVVRVGITEYAAGEMGDIVYVSLPAEGDEISRGDSCGELESTKSVSDINAPVSGVVTAVNEQLSNTPELVNSDPYGDGWMFELEMSDQTELDDLLDADAYGDMIHE